MSTPTTSTATELDVVADAPTPGPSSRRRFLIGGGVLAVGAVAAACSSDDPDTTTGGTAAGGGENNDLATAAFAASLEVLAVNTYQAAANAATSGALGDVPPAVVEFVTVSLGQHQQAVDTWNGVLTGAGQAAVTAPPPTLEATVNEQFAAVTDAGGAATLALMLESIASNTYLAAMPTLVDPAAITLAGQLQYVGQQRAAVLLFALGQYPVPDVFQKTELAASPG